MSLVSLICPECKEAIKIDDSKQFGFCFSCGAKIAIGTLVDSGSNSVGIKDAIENYIQLATSAKVAGNNLQCEMYCNKIIELDATNAAAWALKASASGWQSSLSNLRIEEMILYYSKAVQYAQDPEQILKIQDMASSDYGATMTALFDLQCDRFQKWPDEEEAAAFSALHLKFLQWSLSLLNGTLCGFKPNEVLADIAVKVNNSIVDTQTNLINSYRRSNSGHPTDFDFSRFIEQMGHCYTAFDHAASMASEDYDNYCIIIDNMINNHNNCIGANSYSHEYLEISGWVWWPHLTLTDEAVRYRQREIRELNAKKAKANQSKTQHNNEVRQKCIDKYWEEHAQRKSELLINKGDLQRQIGNIRSQIGALEKANDLVQISNEINALTTKRNNLGVLKFKEKKTLAELIDNKQKTYDSILSSRKQPLEDQIRSLESKVRSIDNELSAARPEYQSKINMVPYTRRMTARSITMVLQRARV